MREVSWRALGLPLKIGARAGSSAEELLNRAGLPSEVELRRLGRLDWSAYVRLLNEVARVVGDLDQLEAWSAELSTTAETQQAATIAAAFMNPQSFFWSAHKWVAKSLFGVMETEFEVLSPTSVRLSAIIPEPHEPSVPLFRIAAGSFGTAPVVAGYSAARVRSTIVGRRCDYLIEHEPSRSVFTRLRRLLTSVVALPRLFSELREQNDALSTQIAQLDRAGQVAEAASKLRQRFLTAVTHEVRTPLSEIIGLARLIAEGATREETFAHAHQIELSATSLLGRIDDVDLAERGTQADVALDRRAFQPDAALSSWGAAWRQRAEAKGLKLALVVEVGHGVVGDSGRIFRALEHLVDNAIKFSSRGTITISLREPTPGHIRYTVADEGPGIESFWVDRIFEPFVQRESGLARRFGGIGLGLTVARRLAESMGGRIEVTSVVEQGSSFTLALPMPRGEVVLETKAPPAILAPSQPEPSAAPNRSEEASTPARLRVLVVEDNAVNQKVLCRILQQLGFVCDVANNGLEAVEAFGAAEYAAILMDLQMPVMDGFTATLEIRKLETSNAKSHVPIIAVTANNQVEFQGRAREVGMDGFLGKPIQRASLGEALGKWIAPS